MSKKITSFAAFLEQTEQRQQEAETTRAVSAPDTKIVSDTNSASGLEITSHMNSAPDTEFTSHVKNVSDVKTTSDAKKLSEPVQKVWDVKNASGANSAPVRGHLRVPNDVIHNILPTLKPSEAIVLLRLYALSHGFQKTTCVVSLDKLASSCNLSRTQTRVCVRSLESKRHIRSLGIDNTNSERSLRGLHIEVRLPSATRAETAPDTETVSGANFAPNKDINIKGNTHKGKALVQPTPSAVNEEGRATRGVGVGSEFSLEECRRFADHLHKTGQGITNPGGYAATIHRSGAADELIRDFLNPSQPDSALDPIKCPDCQGTGFKPSIRGTGVTKCLHEKLKCKSPEFLENRESGEGRDR